MKHVLRTLAAWTAPRGRRSRRRMRGLSSMEMLVATGIATSMMGVVASVYVTGTRSFYREQAESYVQLRARTALDAMASETRAARAFLGSVTLGTDIYTASDGSTSPACLILLVPAQDHPNAGKSGLFYYGAGSAHPNTLVMDTIVYWHDTATQTLYRRTAPARDVLTAEGVVRSSYRPVESGVVVARDVTQLRLNFKDRDGRALPPNNGPQVAAVDLKAEVSRVSTLGGAAQNTVAISGVRLRNMRSGSIYGMVSPAVAGVSVKTIVTGVNGPYPRDTQLGAAVTAANGYFEVCGLAEGQYSLKFRAPSGAETTVSGPITVEPEKNVNQGTVAIAH